MEIGENDEQNEVQSVVADLQNGQQLNNQGFEVDSSVVDLQNEGKIHENDVVDMADDEVNIGMNMEFTISSSLSNVDNSTYGVVSLIVLLLSSFLHTVNRLLNFQYD